MSVPDYKGGSIVNLMSSVVAAFRGHGLLYPPLPQLPPSVLGEAKNVVLWVVDGLGYGYLARHGADSLLGRYLQGKITSVFPATTATAITAFLTGTAPQQHGLTGWFVYFREIGRVVAVLPLQPRPSGMLAAGSGIIDPAALFDPKPVFDRIGAQSYVVLPKRIARSAFNLAYCGTAQIRPYASLTQCFKIIASILKEHRERKYIYAYWPELDHLGHTHGIRSQAVAAHFARLNDAFERFLKDIQGSETMVVVTADHGMVDSGATWLIELATHPALADTLALPLCGDRRVAYCYVHRRKRRAFEDYVRRILGDSMTLFESGKLIEEGYFGLGPAHPELGTRVGDYTLLMKERYTLKDWLPGERREVQVGAHGGLSDEELYVPLVVVKS